MKTTIALFALLPILAFAQGISVMTVPAPTSIAAGATTNIAASVLATSNLDLSSKLSYQRPYVTLAISGTCPAASNGTVTVTFVTSKDSVIWDNPNDSLLVITATATNGAFANSDYANLAGRKYLGVGRISVGNSGAVSGFSAKAVANP